MVKKDRPFVSATLWGLVLALLIGALVQYVVFVLLGVLAGPGAEQGTTVGDYFLNGIFFAGVFAPINVILGVALGLAYAATGRPVSRRRAAALGLIVGIIALALGSAWLGGSLFTELAGETFFFYLNMVLTVLPTCVLVALAIRWRVPILPPLEE